MSKIKTQADRKLEARIKLEKQIARAFVKEVLATGCTISVHDGEEFPVKRSKDAKEILDAMMSTDEDRLYVRKDGDLIGVAQFVYGNDGWDVLANYHVSLEPYMTAVNKIVQKYS